MSSGELQRRLAVDQAANQETAVAENAGADQLRRQLVGRHPREVSVAMRELIEGGLGVRGAAMRIVVMADPGGVAELDQSNLPVGVRALPVGAGELVDLGLELFRGAVRGDLRLALGHGGVLPA